MDTSATVLVLGATGQQGSATARALIADGRSVRALVRDRQTGTARDLAGLGIELVLGDLGQPETLEDAMRGVNGIFCALPSSADARYGLSDADEVRFGTNVVDAAKRSGVDHLVYSSTIGASPHLGLGHYESKWHIENALRRSGVPFTIVRPAPFIELLLYPHFGLREGVVAFFGSPERSIQLAAVQDIGALAAKLLVPPSRPQGMTIDIASDALSGHDIAAKISRATGRHVPYVQIVADTAGGNPMIANLARAIAGGKLDGHADLVALRALHPDLLTFDRWLAAGHADAIRELLPISA